MNNRVVAVLTVIKCLHAQKILPSPPKIVYGGFVPIIMDNQFSENINVEHKLSFDRKSKSLPLYTDKISQSKDKSKNNFSFSIKQFVTLQASICSSLAQTFYPPYVNAAERIASTTASRSIVVEYLPNAMPLNEAKSVLIYVLIG